jgi:hypothetical protein
VEDGDWPPVIKKLHLKKIQKQMKGDSSPAPAPLPAAAPQAQSLED